MKITSPLQSEPKEERSLLANALLGAGLGGLLPGASLADYELRQYGEHRDRIKNILEQADREGKIRVSSHVVPMRDDLKLGDVATVFSHAKSQKVRDLLDPRKIGDNLVSLSAAAGGQGSYHTAVANHNGNLIDAGVPGTTRLSRTLNKYLPIDELKEWKAGRTPLRELLSGYLDRAKDPTDVGNDYRSSYEDKDWRSILDRHGNYGPFAAGDAYRAGIVTHRAKNLSGITEDQLGKRIVEHVRQPYSKERATLAGMFKLLVPGSDKLPNTKGGEMAVGPNCTGTFCSMGGNNVLAALGHKTKTQALPADILLRNDLDLVGVGINNRVLREGGGDKLTAAKKLFGDSLKDSRRLRRGLGGVLTGVGSVAGAGLGVLSGLIGSKEEES